MADPHRPPKARPGYWWSYHTGCRCPACPSRLAGGCKGEDWPHWIEVKIAPTVDGMED